MLYAISRIFVAIALLVTLWGTVADDAVALPLDSESNCVTLDIQKGCDADPDHNLFNTQEPILAKNMCNIFPLAANIVHLDDPGLPPPSPPPDSL